MSQRGPGLEAVTYSGRSLREVGQETFPCDSCVRCRRESPKTVKPFNDNVRPRHGIRKKERKV